MFVCVQSYHSIRASNLQNPKTLIVGEMKKKNKKSIDASISTKLAVNGGLESLIHSHGEFFDRLVELVPSKFYVPNNEVPKPWYQGLSKAAKASLKLQSIVNRKLARRRRFDTDSELPSSDLKELEDNAVDLEVNKDAPSPSVTYEDLRQKLRQKIEAMRGGRGGANGEKTTAYKNDNNVKNGGKKRKRNGENAGGASGKGDALEEEEEEEEIMEYGKVRLGDEGEWKGREKKGKISKANELKRVKRLQEVKKQNPGIVDRESWKAAANRAMGVKVHDDAGLIKESMKRVKRKKEKSAETWKERVETQDKMKQQRQQKRKENIDGRIKDKKMRKMAKREKKLMRPSFEGGKDC